MMQKENLVNYADSGKRELIQPAVSYIHERYTTETLKVTQLAAMCGISPEYFRSIFQSFYGVPPVKYINRLKMEHASELLSSGMYSVTEAATLSGYNDLSHFSREFKKTYGIKPTDF
jgi:AraC-like DNA-binding protein